MIYLLVKGSRISTMDNVVDGLTSRGWTKMSSCLQHSPPLFWVKFFLRGTENDASVSETVVEMQE